MENPGMTKNRDHLTCGQLTRHQSMKSLALSSLSPRAHQISKNLLWENISCPMPHSHTHTVAFRPYPKGKFLWLAVLSLSNWSWAYTGGIAHWVRTLTLKSTQQVSLQMHHSCFDANFPKHSINKVAFFTSQYAKHSPSGSSLFTRHPYGSSQFCSSRSYHPSHRRKMMSWARARASALGGRAQSTTLPAKMICIQ